MRLKTITKRVSALQDKQGLHSDLVQGVNYLLYAAMDNANETIHVEQEQTEDKYEQIALSSLEVLLAGSNEPDVQAWYRKQGFTW